MINATSWDIEVYYRLQLRRNATTPNPGHALSWSLSGLSGLSTSERDLYQYFKHSLSTKLSTFSSQPLGSTLMRIASSDASKTSAAVQRAFIAIAALYRHGPGFLAEELKLYAVQALIAAAGEGMDAKKAVQHVAASIILIIFETHQSTPNTNQWLSYLRAATSVISSVSAEAFCMVTDGTILLEWAYYHGVLARFTLRHWKRHDSQVPRAAWGSMMPGYLSELTVKTSLEAYAPDAEQRRRQLAALAPLNLLSRVISEVLPPRSREAQKSDYKARIRDLSDEARSLAVSTTRGADGSATQYTTAKAEAYRIATLVYLSRATDEDLIPESEIRAAVHRGLNMVRLLSSCERPLPLLVLGCEARTDDDRLRVMSLSDKKNDQVNRDLQSIQSLLSAFWTQDDLLADGGHEVDYMDKLSAAFSSSALIPHFG